MTNLAVTPIESERAAAAVAGAIRDELPTADIATVVEGDSRPPSFWQAVRHELAAPFKDQDAPLFVVIADVREPRPFRVRCTYVQWGRLAVVASVTYLVPLRYNVFGHAAYTGTSWGAEAFDGEAALCEALGGADDLVRRLRRFLRRVAVYGTLICETPITAKVIPDSAGAFFAADCAPRARWKGLGPYALDVRAFLDITDRVEKAIDSVPGARRLVP